MPQTVIDRVNHLGKDQPEQFIFTDRKGQLIGDVEDLHGDTDLEDNDDVELPGVDGGLETPPNPEPIPETKDQTEIDITDLNINENNQMIDPESGIEVDIIPDANLENQPVPDAQVPDTKVDVTPQPTPTPDVTPGV